MHARILNRALAGLAVLAMVTLANAQPEQPSRRNPRGSGSVFTNSTATGKPIDLTFGGGNAAEYVEALRAIAPSLNVVLEPDAALIRIEPVVMRHVDAETAIYLLDEMTRTLDDHQMIKLEVETIHRHPETAPLYQVFVERRTSRAQTNPMPHVWSLRELVEGGMPADHVLMATEAALDLAEDDPPAKLRFHPETHLLLVHAQPAQLETIDSIVTELTRAHRESGPSDEEREVDAMHGKLANTTAELQQARRQLVDYASKIGVLERQMDMLDSRFQDAVAALQAERSERFEMELMVQRLQQQLDGTREPD